MTEEQYLLELEALRRDAGDGLTSAEIGAVLNLGVAAVRTRLKRWISEGKYEPTRKLIPNLAGGQSWACAYRRKEPEKGGEKHG